MLGGYYFFYPGDYLRDTSGLSLLEHGAYNLLLHTYYAQAGGLKAEKPRLYRICGARTAEEERAVDFIVDRFFINKDGNLCNKRADKELACRRSYSEEQSRKGKLGGRPRKKPNESRTKAEGKAERKPGESPPAPDLELAVQDPPAPAPAPDPAPKDQERIVHRPKNNGRFTQPTLAEVTDYCKARGNNVDPIRWHAHYTANGWRVGRNPMKSWKAAVVTWERGNL